MIRYALGWLLIGSVVTVVALVLLDARPRSDEKVSLPPVQEIELSAAIRHAGCSIRRALRGERLDPPVDGPGGGPAATPGVYETPQRSETLGSATRRGLVVILYRADLPREKVDELRTLQRAVPRGTIVAPSTARAPYELAVAGYRRLLRCRRFSAGALDATRLFQGRYLGQGPETRG